MLRGVISAPYETVSCAAFVGREDIDFSLQRDSLCVIRCYERIDTDDACLDTFDNVCVPIREGEVMIPDIQLNEPLMTECLHFIECVESGRQSFADWHDGLNVVMALEAASQSMRQNSVCVPVS